jgi:ABC-type transport system involved in cytochrome bd biosynthesis fused ATPase/permease subunit
LISNKGLLRHRLRVLVTHYTHFLPHCDWVIVMDEGTITHQVNGGGLVFLTWKREVVYVVFLLFVLFDDGEKKRGL